MKTWIKILLGLIVLGMIGGALGYKYIYNKPHRDYEKASPDFIMEAADLFGEYHANKQTAQLNYNGKVLQIEGILNDVEKADSLTIAVFVLDEGMFGDEGIRCSMLPNHADAVMNSVGKNIKIKGYVSGYNDTDIVIEKCSVVK